MIGGGSTELANSSFGKGTAFGVIALSICGATQSSAAECDQDALFLINQEFSASKLLNLVGSHPDSPCIDAAKARIAFDQQLDNQIAKSPSPFPAPHKVPTSRIIGTPSSAYQL